MASLQLHFLAADRKPLNDTLDVHITEASSNKLVDLRKGISGKSKLTVSGLAANTVHLVRVFPSRHRPVGGFWLTPGGDKPRTAQFHSPIHPDRVIDVKFPQYEQLPSELRTVLEASTLEGHLAATPPMGRTAGQVLYEDRLSVSERAGLLNLFCKMSQTRLGAESAWTFVTDLYRIRGDRIFARVAVDYRDRVKDAATIGLFKKVDGSLHTPPPTHAAAGSFKTTEHYGNLQLTFFSTRDAPLAFIVDADIDDAAGIGHVFQVLSNFLTQGATNPFDIHQILTFHQSMTVPYELVV